MRKNNGKAAPRRYLPTIFCTVAVVLLLGASLLIEFYGGNGLIPSWDSLHSLLGLETGIPVTAQAPGTTTVTFFDVGQGDAVLIAQDGEYCLIDAGPYDAKDELAADLRTAGVTTLKYLAMTHPHADHIGGMPTVLQGFAVQTLLLPDLETAAVTSGTLDAVLRYAKEQQTATVYAETGMELSLGTGTLTVLSTGMTPVASADETTGEDAVNDLSLCLHFAANGFSFLDTGDAEATEEAALVAQYGGTLKSTLLKAGHHGSSTSNTQDLLAAVQPQAVVVSCGVDNAYGHPHGSVLRRCAESNIAVYRTDLQGTVAMQWQQGSLRAITAEQQAEPTELTLAA